MTFMPTPMVGIDPMPAFSPDPEKTCKTAQDWAESYNVYPTFAQAMKDLMLDIQERENAGMDDDEEEFLLRVVVMDNGDIDIFDTDADTPFIRHTAKDVFDAFGLNF